MHHGTFEPEVSRERGDLIGNVLALSGGIFEIFMKFLKAGTLEDTNVGSNQRPWVNAYPISQEKVSTVVKMIAKRSSLMELFYGSVLIQRSKYLDLSVLQGLKMTFIVRRRFADIVLPASTIAS